MNLILKAIMTFREKGFVFTCKKVICKFRRYIGKNSKKKVNRNIEYQSVYQENIIWKEHPRVKALVFYLPQFHEIPENNIWWGKGFTEWTNVKKATSKFPAHYQPRLPHKDFGFYDLSLVDCIKKQVDLAKEHGIFGFCFYYYWFSSKKLLFKPLDLLLSHPEIQINFCLCWANENWTRTWSGNEKDVLIAQHYDNSDPHNLIADLKKYVQDKRYICVNGRPVFIIYNINDIINPIWFISELKKEAIQQGIGELSIWVCGEIKNKNLENELFKDLLDRKIEFPPHNMGYQDIEDSILGLDGKLWNYSLLVDRILQTRKTETNSDNTYRTVMLGWDNSPRRLTGYNAFTGFDLRKYYSWLKANVEEAIYKFNYEERFVFINAWNEWAEGTYLEPDKKFGYASINTTSQALFLEDFSSVIKSDRKSVLSSKVAVQLHVHYVDLIDEMIGYLNNINVPFDCFVSTNSYKKASYIYKALREKCNANYFEIMIIENKGRDVAPLLLQMKNRCRDYEYLCHIHTKKSKHLDGGNLWRNHLLRELLGSKAIVDCILKNLETNKALGLVIPSHYEEIGSITSSWGENKAFVNNFLLRIGLPKIPLNKTIPFPSGNMFWARSSALEQAFLNSLSLDDFPDELGQLDGTLMHGIERSWPLIVRFNGYRTVFSSDIFNSKKLL